MEAPIIDKLKAACPRHWSLWLLLICCALVLGAQIYWQEKSAIFLRNDSTRHAFACSHLDDNRLESTFPYPKLVHRAGAIALRLTDRSPRAFFWLQSTAIILLVLATYACGRTLGGELQALLAALFVLCNPLVQVYWHHFGTDMMMAAFCMASLLSYLRSDHWQRSGWCIAFLACFLLAAFTRFAFLLFAIVYLPAIALDILRYDCRRRQQLANPPAAEWGYFGLYLFSISIAAGFLAIMFPGDPVERFMIWIFLLAAATFIWKRFHYYGPGHRFLTQAFLTIALSSYIHIKISTCSTQDYFEHVAYTTSCFGTANGLTLSALVAIAYDKLVTLFTTLKGYALSPWLFWPTLAALVCIIRDRTERQNYLALIITICSYIPLVHLASGCDRIYLPITGFCALLAAAFLQRWHHISRIFSLALVAFVFIFSLGWMYPQGPWGQCPPEEMIIANTTYDRNMQPFDPQHEHKLIHDNRVRWLLNDSFTRVTYHDEHQWHQLANCGTVWSDKLFFTIPPYRTDWWPFFHNVADQLPPDSDITVMVREDERWNNEITNYDELSAYILFGLDFCAPEKRFVPNPELTAHDGEGYLITVEPTPRTEMLPQLADDRWPNVYLHPQLLYTWQAHRLVVQAWKYRH